MFQYPHIVYYQCTPMKLSIRFGEDKTRSILFSSKRSLKLVEELDIRYKEIKIKQHKHVNYLRCVLDETMSGETMALRVTEKINYRLKFLYRKKSAFRYSPSWTSMQCLNSTSL